jgi:hypothetical protein
MHINQNSNYVQKQKTTRKHLTGAEKMKKNYLCLSPEEVERNSQLQGMAISFLRTPFKRLVAFFKIEVSFLQCTHQDAKNSTRTTSDLLPPG